MAHKDINEDWAIPVGISSTITHIVSFIKDLKDIFE
jgi:hypothetical protein